MGYKVYEMTDKTKNSDKPRWVYRFDNFKRAYKLLEEAIDKNSENPLNQLEREGVIQRFEYSWELAWKLIKDFGEHEGIVFERITPGQVIKTAFQAKIINQGDIWMQALDDRNKMAHSYNFSEFERVILNIEQYYLPIFNELYVFLLEKAITDSE